MPEDAMEMTAEDEVRAAFGHDPSKFKDEDEDLLPETGEEDGEQNPESTTDDSVEDEPAQADESVGEQDEPEKEKPEEDPEEFEESEEDSEDEDEEFAKLNREAPRRGDFERLEELYKEQKMEARSQSQQAEALRDKLDQQVETAQEASYAPAVTESVQQYAQHREEMEERQVSPAQIVREIAEIRSGGKEGDETNFLPYLRNGVTDEELNEMVVGISDFGELRDDALEVIESIKTEAAANTAAYSKVLQAHEELQAGKEADIEMAREIMPEIDDENGPERAEFLEVVEYLESEFPGYANTPGAATFAVKQLLLKWSDETAQEVQEELEETTAKLTALQQQLSGATAVDAGRGNDSNRSAPEIDTLRAELAEAFSNART